MSEFDSHPPLPPAYRTAVARRAPLSVGWKLVLGCGSLILLAGAVFVGWVIYLGTRSVPDSVEVEVDTPVSVPQGESFVIVARVTNGDDRGHTLVDLDVADSFLKGVIVRSTEPPYAESLHVPLADVRSYTFDLAVPVGKTVEVRMHAVAAYAGDHEGEFEFCIDSELVCTPYLVRMIVVPADGGRAPAGGAEAGGGKGGS